MRKKQEDESNKRMWQSSEKDIQRSKGERGQVQEVKAFLRPAVC